jgi:hypothetical protein
MRYLPDSIESLSRRIRRRHEAGLWIFNPSPTIWEQRRPQKGRLHFGLRGGTPNSALQLTGQEMVI